MKSTHLVRSAGLLCVAAMILLGTGCSPKKTTTNTNAAVITNTPSITNTNTAAVPTNTADTNTTAAFSACQLYSQAEAESMAGITLLPPDPVTGEIFRHTTDTNYYCVYATADKSAAGKTVWVGIDRFTTAGGARASFDDQKLRLDQTTDITGYGDAAYWDRDQGFFRVLRGSDIFTTQVLVGVTGNQTKATTVMQTIMGRV
jgi:hypothetical protein